MRCAVLLGILLSAALAPAVTIAFDTGQSVVRPDGGTAFLLLTGSVNYGGTPSSSLSGVSMGSLIAYGPGAPFATSDAAAAGNILGHFATGTFAGPLMKIAIDATTAPGTYSGTGQLSLRFGSAPPVLTTTAPLSFTVLAAPVATPEPMPLAALGLGLAVAIRRRPAPRPR